MKIKLQFRCVETHTVERELTPEQQAEFDGLPDAEKHEWLFNEFEANATMDSDICTDDFRLTEWEAQA